MDHRTLMIDAEINGEFFEYYVNFVEQENLEIATVHPVMEGIVSLPIVPGMEGMVSPPIVRNKPTPYQALELVKYKFFRVECNSFHQEFDSIAETRDFLLEELRECSAYGLTIIDDLYDPIHKVAQESLEESLETALKLLREI